MITSSFPRFEGDFFGPWILDYCRELKRQGCEVYVLAPRPVNTPKTVLSEPNLFIYRFNYFYPIKLQKLVYPPGMIPSLKQHKFLLASLPFLFLQYFQTGYKLLTHIDFDVIHSQWAIPSGLIGTLLAKRFNLPHFITTQGAEFYLSAYNPLTFATKWAIRNSEMVLPVSTMMRERALQLGIAEQKVRVVPNAVNTEFFKRKNSTFRMKHDIPDNKFMILTIRRLVYEKRVEDVINAFAKMKYRDQSYLVIGGDGPDRQKLELLVDDLGLSSQVLFLGFIENNKLDRIYSVADCYILSSQQEGLSLSMLESMASEVITISTRGTGGNDVINEGKTGFLYGVGKISELQGILDMLFAMSPEKREKIRKEGRKIVEKQFSTEVMVSNLITEYKSAIKRRAV